MSLEFSSDAFVVEHIHPTVLVQPITRDKIQKFNDRTGKPKPACPDSNQASWSDYFSSWVPSATYSMMNWAIGRGGSEEKMGK